MSLLLSSKKYYQPMLADNLLKPLNVPFNHNKTDIALLDQDDV